MRGFDPGEAAAVRGDSRDPLPEGTVGVALADVPAMFDTASGARIRA